MKAIWIVASLWIAAPTPSRAQPPDMASYWPNTDGLAWEYSIVAEGIEFSSSTTGRLRFDGTLAVPGGAEAQNLVEEAVADPPSAPPGSITDPLLRNLCRARPDLREAVELRASGRAIRSPAQGIWEPLLLHGGAFDIDDEKVFTWQTTPELTEGPNWIFLVSDLTIGNTFQIQLVPDLADDVFLYGTIAAVEEVSCSAGVYPGALRVDYRVDYGESECTGEGTPDPTGTFRNETRGSVHYAPGVGPVRAFEEFLYTEVTGDCGFPPGTGPGEPLQTYTVCLSATPVAVEEATWGGIKRRLAGP